MMKKALLLFSFPFYFFFTQAQTTVNGTLNYLDHTFNRPDSGSPPIAPLSAVGTHVYYNVIPFTVTTTPKMITIYSTGSMDTFGFLYGPGGFNPMSPFNNIILGDDDSFGGGNFALTYNFTVPGTYYVVLTTYKSNVTGSYSLSSTAGGVLPVRLLSFTAEKAGSGKNLLKWSTAGESDIDSYQVQHSNDGSHFTDIAGAAIEGSNVSTTSYYSFTDVAPFDKLNYYRLKINDRVATVKYSPNAVVNNSQSRTSGSISIFPNPAVNYLNIQTVAGQKGKAAVSIISAAGQIVYKSDYTIANESIINLNVKNLSAGNYVVRIKTANGETTTVPFVKH
jgi:hypothetical protein